MSNEPESASGAESGPSFAPTLWKKIVLGIAGAFVVVGGGLTMVGSGQPELDPAGDPSQSAASREGAQGGVDAPVQGLSGGAGQRLDGGATGEDGGVDSAFVGEEAAQDAVPWNRFFLKGGFSLFVGFCIGFALRTFLKISLVVAGVIALALMGLSYGGFVEVDWASMETHFNDLTAKLKEEAGSFKDFIAGNLPSAGMATLGLLAGFKRR